MTNILWSIHWKLAKLGVKMIKAWIRDQYAIDEDYVQVYEILHEWFEEELE